MISFVFLVTDHILLELHSAVLNDAIKKAQKPLLEFIFNNSIVTRLLSL